MVWMLGNLTLLFLRINEEPPQREAEHFPSCSIWVCRCVRLGSLFWVVFKTLHSFLGGGPVYVTHFKTHSVQPAQISQGAMAGSQPSTPTVGRCSPLGASDGFTRPYTLVGTCRLHLCPSFKLLGKRSSFQQPRQKCFTFCRSAN